MSHNISIIHVATSCFLIQRLLAWPISTCNSYSSRGCWGLPRHTIMCNLLGSTWKSRSDYGEHWKGAHHSWEHWKGAPPFVSRQCFPNKEYQRLERDNDNSTPSCNQSMSRSRISPYLGLCLIVCMCVMSTFSWPRHNTLVRAWFNILRAAPLIPITKTLIFLGVISMHWMESSPYDKL